MFDYPSQQMTIHMFMTMATILYYANGNLFQDNMRKWVEIATEALLFLFSCLLQQFMNRAMTEDQGQMISKLIYGTLVILVLVNVTLLILTVYKGKMEKKRTLMLLSNKFSYEIFRKDHLQSAQIKQNKADMVINSNFVIVADLEVPEDDWFNKGI